MKQLLSCILIAVTVICCAFPALAADPACSQTPPSVTSETPDDACPCDCHLMFVTRSTLLEKILDRTIDAKTLFRVVSYYIRVFTWHVLGVRQYCECGSRHY